MCVTVWKRFDNKSYIIPDKYYGVLNPSDNYIKTTNTQYLTLYFNSNFPNMMAVRNQGSSTGLNADYEIINNLPEKFNIHEYSEEYKAILYEPEAKKFKDVKVSTEYIDLNIKENYATDKTGKKIQ